MVTIEELPASEAKSKPGTTSLASHPLSKSLSNLKLLSFGPLTDEHTLDDFEERLALLITILQNCEARSEYLEQRVQSSESEVQLYSSKLDEAQTLLSKLDSRHKEAKQREEFLTHELARTEALLEAQRLQSVVSEHELQDQLVKERTRSEHLRTAHFDVKLERDEALSELASQLSDSKAKDAMLADAALYIEYLHRQNQALKVENSRHAARVAQVQTQDDVGPFSLASIKTAIKEAVQDAGRCDESERKKRIRQLQLRWHPDKNPVLKEFATEVTKLINESVTELEAGSMGGK